MVYPHKLPECSSRHSQQQCRNLAFLCTISWLKALPLYWAIKSDHAHTSHPVSLSKLYTKPKVNFNHQQADFGKLISFLILSPKPKAHCGRPLRPGYEATWYSSSPQQYVINTIALTITYVVVVVGLELVWELQVKIMWLCTVMNVYNHCNSKYANYRLCFLISTTSVCNFEG